MTARVLPSFTAPNAPYELTLADPAGSPAEGMYQDVTGSAEAMPGVSSFEAVTTEGAEPESVVTSTDALVSGDAVGAVASAEPVTVVAGPAETVTTLGTMAAELGTRAFDDEGPTPLDCAVWGVRNNRAEDGDYAENESLSDPD